MRTRDCELPYHLKRIQLHVRKVTICAVGVVTVQDGTIVDRWTTLINPEAEFNQFNVGIHGITPEDVQDAPKFPGVHQALKDRLEGNTMVSHGAFDVAALDNATYENSLTKIQYDYINSQRSKRQQRNKAVKFTGKGDPSGIFAGEVVVFTGAAGIARKQLAETAKRLGIAVKDSVTKDTTMLVSGDQDSSKIKGKNEFQATQGCAIDRRRTGDSHHAAKRLLRPSQDC